MICICAIEAARSLLSAIYFYKPEVKYVRMLATILELNLFIELWFIVYYSLMGWSWEWKACIDRAFSKTAALLLIFFMYLVTVLLLCLIAVLTDKFHLLFTVSDKKFDKFNIIDPKVIMKTRL